MAKIAKESPGLVKLLQQSGGQATITSTEQNLTPLAKSSYQSKTLV